MSKKTAKKDAETTENNNILATANASLVVDGLAELTKADKLVKIKALQATKATKAKATKARDAKVDRLVALRDGTVDSKLNPKGRHNPSLLPDTLRPAFPGEQINGKDAKGWVVTIRCQDTVSVPELDEDGYETGETVKTICGTDRLINTQDAFQTRFCEEHKGAASRAAGKARRDAKKDAELLKLSDEQLDAELAALEQEAA